MCGITGFCSNKSIKCGQYYQAHKTIDHRGPDDEGFLVVQDSQMRMCKGSRTISEYEMLEDVKTIDRANLMLGQSRLAILDLSAKGHQPFQSESLNQVIVYNGEIYNYLELRKELQSLNYIFHTDSDTEVVLNAYLQWGNRCFSRFNGMWSIAIYNRDKDELILSRDRFGIKPLYYFISDETIYFSSEIKFILEMTGIKKANEQSVYDYLNHSCIEIKNNTMFSNIFAIEPAHVLSFKNGKINYKRRYWEIVLKNIEYDKGQAEEKFQYLFEDSLRLRMRSDVPVGSLLSGGLDSSIIVGGLVKLGMLTPKYQTFSAVYKEQKFSEEKYIRDTEAKYNLNSNYLYVTSEDVINSIDTALWHAETPIRAIPMIVQCLLYKHIKENSNVKVMLNGQGADELFAGYTNNYYELFWSLLSGRKIAKCWSELNKFHINRGYSYKRIAMEIYKVSKSGMKGIACFNQILFNQILYSPLKEYLLYDDRAAMAYGLEARAPFMDYRMVEFAFTLNSQYKIDNFENKKIERDYGKACVAESILNRKDKMGFTSPQEMWQKREMEEMIREVYLQIKSEGVLGIDGNRAYSLYEDYQKGINCDWAMVWRIFCMKRWQQIFEISNLG